MMIYLDKFGLYFSAYLLGPIYTMLVGLLSALIYGIVDQSFLIRSIWWLVSGALLSIGFKYSKVENRRIVGFISLILGVIIIPLGDLILYSILFYYPLVDHVIAYSNFFNLFVNQFIDSCIAFITVIIYGTRLKSIKLPKKLFFGINIYHILTMLLLIIILVPSYAKTVSDDYALDGRIPVPEGWTYVVTRMDFVWGPMGTKGVNYYLYPPGRFNSSDPGYQVWFGVYWIHGRYGIYGDNYIERIIYAFSIIDQDVWLGLHGKKDPKTTVYEVKGIAWGELDGYKALFMNGSYYSQSDVPPYEDVILTGFLIVLYIPKYDRTAIVYACAVDKYWSVMEEQLWELAYSIDFP